MDFAFYDNDPSTGFGARLLRPFRRLLRRIQRPYFYRLRDLLAHLFHRSEVDRHCLNTLEQRVNQLEARSHKPDFTSSPLQAKVLTADYLAMSRRVAAIEDVLTSLHSAQATQLQTELSEMDELAVRLRRLELLVDKLQSVYNLDEILPMNGEAKKTRSNAA